MHYHDNTNIVFMLHGGCIENRKNTSCQRVAADILFLHAGETHETVISCSPAKYISLDIEAGLLSAHGLDEDCLLNSIAVVPDAKFLLLKMYHELLQTDTCSKDSIQMLFLEFSTLSKKVQHKKNPPGWIKIIYELLNDKWDESITLADLSIAAGVNAVTISRYFPAYFASTLGAYRRKLKVERSLSIISKGKTSLTGAAYDCNFSDQSHFIRTFKQLTSFSPGAYRRMVRTPAAAR